MTVKPKIIIIVGPTASGKTSLSIKLAQKYNGEIISADSRQVYRGLDLGTGKITEAEMEGIPHHLLDVADPRETYTVADFVRDGRKAIQGILECKKTPILVGGTFLYCDTLMGKISTPGVMPDLLLREKLEQLSIAELWTQLQEKDPGRATTIDTKNKRRLIRALEIIETLGSVPKTHTENPYNALTLGISITKEQLHENIHKRLTDRMSAGMIEEVRSLHRSGLSYERMHDLGIEYRYIAEYLQEKINKEEMLQLIEIKSIQYAKRQMTWLKRNKDIVWVECGDFERVEELVKGFLFFQE